MYAFILILIIITVSFTTVNVPYILYHSIGRVNYFNKLVYDTNLEINKSRFDPIYDGIYYISVYLHFICKENVSVSLILNNNPIYTASLTKDKEQICKINWEGQINKGGYIFFNFNNLELLGDSYLLINKCS